MTDKAKIHDFLDELGDVTNKYLKAGVAVGEVIGALETIKLTIFAQTKDQFLKKAEEPEEDQNWFTS